MSTEELQKEIWFLYGLWYRYYLLYTFLRENKRELELVSKLQERQNELLRLIDFAKINSKSASKWFGTAKIGEYLLILADFYFPMGFVNVIKAVSPTVANRKE